MIRRIWALVSVQHALMLVYRVEIYLWVLASVLPFIMMSIWMTASGAGGVGGSGGHFAMDPVGYARYFLAAFVVRQFSLVWMIYDFEYQMVGGTLSYFLMRPMGTVWNFVVAHLGEQMARFPFFLLVVAVFFCIYPKALWVPPAGGLAMGVLAIYAAFAVRFALQYCLSMMTFWFERASALDQLMMVPYLFLSGLIIPLGDLPPRMAALVRWTPFPYFIDFPARLLTGKLGAGDPEVYRGFAISAGWFAIFAVIGAALWKRGLKEYSGQGA